MLSRCLFNLCHLVVLLSSVHSSYSSCISLLQVEKISSTMATLSWASQCYRSSFIISWSHQQFLACKNKEKLVDIYNKTVVNMTRVEIAQLEPYSVYNFSVSGDDDSVSVREVTEESIPQVCPTPVPDYSLDTSDSLLFQWSVPGLLQCAQYQARLGYLFFKLVGRP